MRSLASVVSALVLTLVSFSIFAIPRHTNGRVTQAVSTVSLETASRDSFDCIKAIPYYGSMGLSVLRSGNYHAAHITLADESRHYPATREVHTVQSSSKNRFVVELIDTLLKIDHSKIKSVVVFDVATDSEINGTVVGIQIIGHNGLSLGKGMRMGNTGLLVCDQPRVQGTAE